MHAIAIIGAGQLGSRHLQALARLDNGALVTVVEPFAESVTRAQSRWSEVAQPMSPTIGYVDRITELPKALDVVIVATAADVRRRVLEELLVHAEVKHLVLEKVLFQALADYAPALALVGARTKSAWVNCPRRTWSFYRSLRERIATDAPFAMSVSGSRWGLGSNAIHFIDLFAFLGKSAGGLAVDALRVSEAHTVRAGFTELVGTAAGHGDRGGWILDSFASGDAPVVVELSSPTLRASVRESEGKAWISTAADKWQWTEEAVEVIPQSRLSHLIVGELLATNTCGLTPLGESVEQHLAFLRPLSRHFGGERCPIT